MPLPIIALVAAPVIAIGVLIFLIEIGLIPRTIGYGLLYGFTTYFGIRGLWNTFA